MQENNKKILIFNINILPSMTIKMQNFELNPFPNFK